MICKLWKIILRHNKKKISHWKVFSKIKISKKKPSLNAIIISKNNWKEMELGDSFMIMSISKDNLLEFRSLLLSLNGKVKAPRLELTKIIFHLSMFLIIDLNHSSKSLLLDFIFSKSNLMACLNSTSTEKKLLTKMISHSIWLKVKVNIQNPNNPLNNF